ncbi:MAG: hypothetical protein PSN34_01635 [Urechidicola sp.]|nr:hypothetical protein [Urechidicola sp.]
MGNNTLGKGFARSRYHQLIGNSKDRRKANHEIKEGLEYSELCNSVDYIEKNIPKTRQQLVWGNPLPKGYESLGKLIELPFLEKNIDAELNLCLIGIRKYKYEINLFLTYKEIYETHLLIGEYQEAENYLSKIENEIYFSLWTLENRFVLKELSGKASENKEFLSYFNEITESTSITKSIVHYLSLRAEHSLSVNRYFNDLEMALSQIKEGTETVTEAFKNYYRFKLTYLSHIDFTNYAGIIALDFGHSIIDRYLNLTRILTNLLAVSSYLDKEDARFNILKQYLQNRINYIIRKVDDPVLYKLKLFSGNSIFAAFNIKESEEDLKIIDLYTSGLYGEVEKLIPKLLLLKPTQFDLYLLYTKSLIYQKKDFKPIGDKKSVQNQILSDIFTITSVKSNPSQAGLNLLRIANNLSSSTLSYGITDFVHYQTQGRKERQLLSRISYNVANPFVHEIYTEKSDKIEFLEMLGSKYPNSITIQFFHEKLKGIDDLMKFKKKIPEARFKVEYANKLQEKKDFINATYEWEYLIENYSDTIPIYELALINLFNCYLELGRLDDCIQLYVNSYFFNNYIIDKIEPSELIRKINSNRFRNVSKTIELPIFYTIANADEVETHIAFELFNRSRSVEKPSELLDRHSDIEEAKLLYYLKNTCSPNILRHSTFIMNSKERLEERLAIAYFIKKLKADNEIDAEIKSIQNILVIQQGLIDLDESKIYVNEQGIIENELSDFKAVFERFQVIAGIAGKNKLLWLEGGKLTTYSSEENTELEKTEYSNNPVFDIYLELFDAVKDKFLNSQFGIVAYLSTRIRHGVLVGELRPIFETHNLITMKEGNTSNYRRNYFWDMVYDGYSHDRKEQIQILLNDFSSKIDGVIFDLIKKHLQVYKTGINEEGWFNYEFDANTLWYHSIASIHCEDFTDFVQQVFVVLWQKTDENLTIIRENIQKEILDQFNDQFNELELNITNQIGQTSCQQLIKSIRDCSTEVQTVIQKISRWFKRSEVKVSNFHLSELVEIISEYTNKSNPYKKLNLTKDLAYDCEIRGEFKTHFTDLLRIFLENIIKHSDEDTSEITCKISTSNGQSDNLKLEIENEITNLDKLESLKNIWQGDKLDTKKLLSEGKSGYHKAFKILTYDLKCADNNCLNTSICDENNLFRVTVNIDINDVSV